MSLIKYPLSEEGWMLNDSKEIPPGLTVGAESFREHFVAHRSCIASDLLQAAASASDCLPVIFVSHR